MLSRPIRALLALALSFAASFAHAAAKTPPPSFPFITANAEAARLDFDAGEGGNERWLGFVASAGESVAIDVVGSSYTDACSVRLEVVDARGAVVGRESCVANVGQAAALTVTADGAYGLHLVGRVGNAGSLRVALRSGSRPCTSMIEATTAVAAQMGSYVLTVGP